MARVDLTATRSVVAVEQDMRKIALRTVLRCIASVALQPLIWHLMHCLYIH